ncbi:MAG: GIY-YIG nuclease family protein [Sediminibacterium sp.]|uniref:GIY-YIG nuclease family protein n=1 Tax=Sediminibacterium sp. TaxID=1917865 RepID=UPI00272580D8|nr:GIY-YIG nuclease family protein [Sediminibacterium sp.]MDO8996520.1 GIY-YIG nuclease family protein [Sediminibacterium sp.]
MKFGKTIKLFLMDGDPNGRMSCELSNWSGKAYKIPRIKIKDSYDRKELETTGVYLLFGKDENENEQVYIGEAESILKRLNQHLTQKEFWNEAIIFFSKDENLNKAHIKYLENKLHELAVKANRYIVENSLVPTQSSISESEKAEMEEFIENIKLLVNTLGHKVFDPKREVQFLPRQEVFSIKAKRGSDAIGGPTSEGFVVYKGSKASATTVPSLSPSFATLRNELISKGILTLVDDTYEFTEDYLFSSPSTAAVMIMGRNANGPLEWKLPNGKNLREFETT